VNCCVLPTAIERLAGVTAIDTSVAAVTVSAALLLVTLPDTALIVVDPVATLVARPAMLIVTTAGTEEFHVAVLVRFCVLLSVYVPIAANCCVSPSGIVGDSGVTAIETNTGAVTVSVVELLIDPDVAVIVVLPCAAVVASPVVLIVPTFVDEELHATVLVRFWVLPSVYVPVAANCWVLPFGIDGPVGLTAIDTSTGEVTARVSGELTVPA